MRTRRLAENVCAVNRAVDAAHALVLYRRLHHRARGGVVERDAAAAVRVSVGESAHEGEGQRDGEVGGGVDVNAAGYGGGERGLTKNFLRFGKSKLGINSSLIDLTIYPIG
jgi:hypothetical protein